jgi:hypothetical protein
MHLRRKDKTRAKNGAVRLQDELKTVTLKAHNVHAYPLQRALLKLSKVLVTTSGPCKASMDPGAQKGTPHANVWNKSQGYLELARRQLERPMAPASSVKQLQGEGTAVARGLSALASTSAVAGTPWQADAIGRMHALRKRQQALEAQAHVCLLSLLLDACMMSNVM